MSTRIIHFGSALAAAACVALGARAQITTAPTVKPTTPLPQTIRPVGNATAFNGSYGGTSFAVISWSLSSVPARLPGQPAQQFVDIVHPIDQASAVFVQQLNSGSTRRAPLTIRGYNAARQAVETMLFAEALVTAATSSAGAQPQTLVQHVRFSYTQMTTSSP